MASLEKLQSLQEFGVGSKKNYVETVEGNALTVFTKYMKCPFGILVTDTNPHFVPMMGIQKDTFRSFPMLHELNGQFGECHLVKVVTTIEPTRPNQKPIERGGHVAALVIHKVLKDKKDKSKVSDAQDAPKIYDSFRTSVAGMLESAKSIGVNIGMNQMGEGRRWDNFLTILNEEAERIGFNGRIIAYKRRQSKS